MENPVDAKAAKRVRLVAKIVLVWAVFIFGRLVFFQVLEHESLKRAASAQHHHIVPIPADRGEILDRTGHPFAISVRTKSVAINPQRVKDPDFFAGLVAPILGEQASDLAGEIRDHQARAEKKGAGRGYLMIKRHISPEEEQRLRSLPFRFIEILRDSRREYPNETTAAHVVGSLDSEGNGNSGIEQKLNAVLEGKPGKMRVLTDSLQDRYVSWVSDPGVQGANISLTLQNVIQHDAEEALMNGIAEAGAEAGSVVVMDPRNGEILAMANYPSFDPRVEKPNAADMEKRRNAAVQAPVEPGSVMKMITVTMGLDSGKFTPESLLFCENGAFPRPGRKPIHDVHHYGTLDVAHVLIKSSNIGVAKISIASGPKLLYEYLKRFGMGDKTMIELPGETRGLLRRLECKGPSDPYCWSTYSHEYIAFGHEIGATSVQLARAVGVIANGGLLVQPHIVLSMQRVKPDGSVEVLPSTVPEPQRVLRAETAFTVRRIMEQVVVEGTGRRAAIPGYTAGGKTGSAEIFENGAWQNKHNSSFIGFAPVTNPRVVVVVTLNRTPKQGGIAAAPVFSKVALTALRVLQVPKDRPEGDVQPKLMAPVTEAPPAEPTPKLMAEAGPEPETIGPELVGPKVPDFRGKAVASVLQESASLGLPIAIVGHGTARGQRPAPGTILPAGARIQVEFARP